MIETNIIEEVINSILNDLNPEECARLLRFEEHELYTLNKSLGYWIRSRYNLYNDSLLYRQMISLKVYYPNDMSLAIIRGMWHQLRNIPFNIKEIGKHEY